MNHSRRIAVTLAGLATAALASAVAAPAALAIPGASPGELRQPVKHAPMAPAHTHAAGHWRHARLADRPDRGRRRAVRGHSRGAHGPRAAPARRNTITAAV